MERIVVAVDGSETRKLVSMVNTLMDRFEEAELIAIYVSPAETLRFGNVPEHFEQALVERLREHVTHTLWHRLGNRVQFYNERGHPVHTICRAAVKLGANLIVIGSHTQGAVDRMLLGSTSQGVVHRSEIPVLVVKES